MTPQTLHQLNNRPTMEHLKTCLYCKNSKPVKEFSKEHILPKSVGGNLDTFNPFVIDNVCGSCNNTMGLYVDSSFAKNYLINNQKAYYTTTYSHLAPNTALTLS